MSGRIEDHDNPEWTEDDFAKADGPGALSAAELAAFPNSRSKGGRPKSDAPKQQVTLRLSQSVIEKFKAEGPGWQSRIDAALARGDLSSPLAELLSGYHKRVERLVLEIEHFRSGRFHVRSNGSDVTKDWIEEDERQIQELREIIDRYAPLVA